MGRREGVQESVSSRKPERYPRRDPLVFTRTYLVEAHELGDEGLQVDDLLAANLPP